MNPPPDSSRPATISTGLPSLDGLLDGGLRAGLVHAIWDTAGWLGGAIAMAVLDHLRSTPMRRFLVGHAPTIRDELDLRPFSDGGASAARDGRLVIWEIDRCPGVKLAKRIAESPLSPHLVIVDAPIWLPTRPAVRPLPPLRRLAAERSMAVVVVGSSGFLAGEHRGWLSGEFDEAERRAEVLGVADVGLEAAVGPGDYGPFEVRRLKEGGARAITLAFHGGNYRVSEVA